MVGGGSLLIVSMPMITAVSTNQAEAYVMCFCVCERDRERESERGILPSHGVYRDPAAPNMCLNRWLILMAVFVIHFVFLGGVPARV